MNFRYCIVALMLMTSAAVPAVRGAEAVFHHTFETVADASGAYRGTLGSGAVLEEYAGEHIVSLGTGGYFDFGSSLSAVISKLSGDYTFTTTVFIPTSTALGANGNFIFNFGRSSSTGYAFFGANQSRYSITQTNWGGEQTVSADVAFPQGEWVSLAVVQNGNSASVYFNGELKKTSQITLHPSALGTTTQHWLGRSPYDGDVALNGARYADFRIYNSALTQNELKELAQDKSLENLNNEIFRQQIAEAVEAYAFDFSDLRSNVILPTVLAQGVTAEWMTSDESLVSASGVVTRPAAGQPDGELTLTAIVTKGDVTANFEYAAVVRARLPEDDCLAVDLDKLSLKGNINNLRTDLVLPAETVEGSEIFWTSGDTDYISDAGKLMRLSPNGEGKRQVVMTATAVIGDKSMSRDFDVYVAEDEGYSSYLFVYFPDNNNENLYYALGTDGYNFTPVNRGTCVMASDTVAIKKGIRDPHILRGEDGKTFYMVATDMKSAEGWNSNRGIVMYKSTDLVNWKHSTVHFPDRFPEWKNVTRVWAPEVIWDPDHVKADGSKGAYMVYFSLYSTDGKAPYDKVYYCYANDDFTDLETAPVFLYDRGSATIDADIIYDERDGIYHMVYKNEGTGGICQVTSTRLTAEPGQPDGSQWSSPSAPLQQTTLAVEGGGMFRLINSDTWVLMYDCYMDGFYQFCSTEDLYNYTLMAQTKTSGAFTPRHGTVIALTQEETDRILAAFPLSQTTRTLTGARNPNVRSDNFKVSGTQVYVPVRPGTDLSSFDPQLSPAIGAKVISPEGEQDFTAGPVTYTVSDGALTLKYQVSCAVEANPVLPGFNADPEIMFSNKTNRFYIYPTTDGYSGWGGYAFYAYSSADLVNWQKEACILDLSTDAVSWATGNAWAPCIEEKYENGAYRYYFYFSGHNPAFNYKTLGCAVSDSPTGPFRDMGAPVVDTNITSGQLIDSDIFTDPADGQTYFYWGNGALVASRMGEDMCTWSDAKVITPAGGTLATHAFREGVYVFKRNDTYYFMWSVDDTGAKNYHVAYGTSDSPMGPITVASSPVILIQDSANEIYGTGHNAVIQIPGRDEWYIVYHRINKNYVSNDPGVHREVCIDRLYFNADGTIKPVTPTHTGIRPVDIHSEGTTTLEETPIQAEKEVVSSLYYTVSGNCAGTRMPTQRGVYIRVDKLSDGSTAASKIVL